MIVNKFLVFSEQPIIDLLRRVRNGEPLCITNVRSFFEKISPQMREDLIILLHSYEGKVRKYRIALPKVRVIDKDTMAFLFSYVVACVYNLLSICGGERLEVYPTSSIGVLALEILSRLPTVFELSVKRVERKGYGRRINVTERILESLSDKKDFKLIIHEQRNYNFGNDMINSEATFSSVRGLEKTVKKSLDLSGKAICGMDIGGTSIKLAVAVDGRLVFLKEHCWFPTNFTTVGELVEPLLWIARLGSVAATLYSNENVKDRESLIRVLDSIRDEETSLEKLKEAVVYAEGCLQDMLFLDAIGIGFPDVVVNNRIVGGEVYKLKGIRENLGRRFEEELGKLSELSDYLSRSLPSNRIKVKILNDGFLAAFTMAVEMVSSGQSPDMGGVFVHTLGTELGSGWIRSDGVVPTIPLECYDVIIDLGSYPDRQYSVNDVRSINNFNTGLSGTAQRYVGLGGVFRLVVKHALEKEPSLYKAFRKKGFLEVIEKDTGVLSLEIPSSPRDVRREFFAYLVSLIDEHEVVRQSFKEMGKYLGVVCLETQQWLPMLPRKRILTGGLVSDPRCYELILQGAKEVCNEIEFDVLDFRLANSPLMKQLKAMEGISVAQFAQAVGAIYWSNLPGS